MIIYRVYILVTRPSLRYERLREQLQQANADAIHFPTIAIIPPDLNLFQEQLKQLNNDDWLIFISPQAVYQTAQYSMSYLPI